MDITGNLAFAGHRAAGIQEYTSEWPADISRGPEAGCFRSWFNDSKFDFIDILVFYHLGLKGRMCPYKKIQKII